MPPLTTDERAVLAVLAEHSRPVDKGEYVVQTAELATVLGTEDEAAIAAALFPLVGRRTERPPGHRDDEWSAVALVSGVRVHGPLCHVEWGPGMRAYAGDLPCSSVDIGRLAEFGLTDSQIAAAVAVAAEEGPERVERNLAYVEAELARGKAIEALGAYTHRAVQGDWAGRAGIAQRKRDAVRRASAAQWETARRSVFPPPALRRRAACAPDALRGPDQTKAAARSTVGDALGEGDAPREESQRTKARRGASGAPLAPVQSTGASRGLVSRSLLVFALSASTVGCSAEQREPASVRRTPDARLSGADSGTSELVGVWDLAEIPPAFGECHEASIGYRDDGQYMTKSGRQIVTGQFSAEPAAFPASEGGAPRARRRGFVVVQEPKAHNGLPNCQGFPADVAVAGSPRTAFVEVARGAEGRPDEARVYFDPQATVPAVVLVRRSSGG